MVKKEKKWKEKRREKSQELGRMEGIIKRHFEDEEKS